MGTLLRKVGGSWFEVPGAVRLNGTTPDPDPEPSDDPADDPSAAIPYTMPTVAPYNVPVANVTPTYDGSGQSVHPSVIDFAQNGLGTWNGYRYWMAHTPYQSGNDDYENPAILVSQNGYYWRKPPGLTRDPVYPMPVTGFSSDTHLVYDPDADEIVLAHRTTLDSVNHTVYGNRSPDGITWPEQPTVSLSPQVEGQPVSPAICRVAENDWRMFALARDTRNLRMWTADTPNGPWAGPIETAGASSADGFWGWHLDVQYIGGVFYATIDRGPLYLGNPDGLTAATSLDGLSWQRGSSSFMTKAASGWDDAQLYRACIQPHENGTHFRLWYSAQSNDVPEVWGTGLTHVPRSAWPTPDPLPTAGVGTDYGTAVAADAPAVWWRMEADPLTTTTEADATGNGRAGTYTGAHVRAPSLSGDATYSTRMWKGSALYRAREAWMDAATFTAEAVVRPRGTFGPWATLSLYGPTWGWSLRGNGSSLQFAHFDGTVVSHFGAFTAGATRHVAVTVTNGTATLYLNGSAVTSGALAVGTPTTDTRLVVGARWTGSGWGDHLDGDVDEVAYYPGATLSETRILAHAQAAGLA